VSHPHALRIDATAGVVVLRGPILQAEVRALLKAIARVDGVRQVINELDVHREATGVPALQGGAAPSDAPSQVSKQGKEKNMATLARDVMTPDPACCSPQTTLDKVAKLMVQNDCGEIPVVDSSDQPIGVITDRDIVARVIAEGRNPAASTAESCMSQPVVTVPDTAPFDEVVSTMEKHQIRRVPVVDGDGCCAGIIAQADVARISREREVAHLVREVSREHAYGLH
jgi:CBS domain-containing protein